MRRRGDERGLEDGRREAVVDGRQEGKGGRGLLGSDVSCDKRQERLLNPKVST